MKSKFFKLSILSLCISFLLTACGSGGGGSSNNSIVKNMAFDQVETPYGRVLNWGNVPVAIMGKKLNATELEELKDILSFKPDNYINTETRREYKTAGGNYSRIVMSKIEGKDPDILAYTGKPTTEKLANLFGRFSYKGKSYIKTAITTSIEGEKDHSVETDIDDINIIVDFNNNIIYFPDDEDSYFDTTAKIYQDGKNIAFKGKFDFPVRKKLEDEFSGVGNIKGSIEGRFMGYHAQELAGKMQSTGNIRIKHNYYPVKGTTKMQFDSVFYAKQQ